MPARFQSLKGQLLLDGGSLGGSFFHRTVVLICEHDVEGAFGLVLNRAADATVGDALVADLPKALRQSPLFIGGPVQPGALSFLHAAPQMPEANVLPGLAMSHSLDELVELGESWAGGQRLKIFAGYSGWSAGQLESEMKRKAWLTHPASSELIFDDPAKLWRRILRGKDWQSRLLADGPDDLSWN